MIEEGKNPNTIHFTCAQNYSAYLELAKTYLNDDRTEEGDTIEINPYFRYHEIFKNLFVKNENIELKQVFMDILLHISFQIERYGGMDHSAFYAVYMEEACRRGRFGKKAEEVWRELHAEEKRSIARGLVELYFSGDMLNIIKEKVKEFFPKSHVYLHKSQGKELLVYTAVEKSMEHIKKVEILKDLFLPMDFGIQIYWKNHFGIIDIDETMVLNQLELY